jgi:histidine triad (HIT) family protein
VTEDCIFCDIVAGRAEASVAYEDGATLALMDLGQLSPGHTLVVTKRHIADIYGLDEDTGRSLMVALPRVARAVRAAFQPDGINIWQSNGAPWQDVFHLHFHVLPRWRDDALLQFRPPRARLSRAELDEQAARIRAVLGSTGSKA